MLRTVSLLGAVAIVGFDIVVDLAAPDEPDMTAVRLMVAVTCVGYFLGTFVSAYLRRNADTWILLLVALFTISWLYNSYLSKFSFSITITLFNVLLGCSLAFKDRRLIAWYLSATMLAVVAVLFAIDQPRVNSATMLTALAVTSGLCYFVLGSWLQSQEALQRNDEDLKKTQFLAGVGGWTLDLRANVFQLSDGARALMNLEGKDLNPDLGDALQYYWPESSEALERAIILARTRGERFDLEMRCREWEGGPDWLRVLGEPDEADSGTQLLHGMLQDISHQKRYEADLIEARDTAERALETRSRFLANMSHEIRTPMNGVIGMASLLRDMELSAEQRELVETIHSSGSSLLTILNDILDFSKIDEGRIELEQEPFSVAQCIADVTGLLAIRAGEKHLQLISSIDPGVPEPIRGDSTRLRQILSNLVANAVKFASDGEVSIAVHGRPQGAGNFELEVQVRDTGIGIPADKLDTLFDAFTQADASTTRLYGGTGLGLSISRLLVELMGGRIWVESEQGVGSTFSFTVVLELVSGSPTSAVAQPQPPASEAAPDRGAISVLLAEDNPVNQQVALKMLARLGYRAELAVNGLDAVRAAEQNHFDLIFMDVQMPQMDGLEATKRIRDLATPTRPYIVALTANAMVEDTDIYLGAGMDAHLPKPMKLESLRSALRQFEAGRVFTSS